MNKLNEIIIIPGCQIFHRLLGRDVLHKIMFHLWIFQPIE